MLVNFKLSEEERARILKEDEDKYYEMPSSFSRIAECMLSGCFVVSSEGNSDVRVYPTVLEFYYHEEEDGGIKDPIVYHRNSNSSVKEIIPTGFLHNHVSGIDLTFEHENHGKVRASVLIREFLIETVNESSKAAMKSFSIDIGKKDGRSTGMYAALFSQFSIFDGFSVKWEDGSETVEFRTEPRKNVHKYETETNNKGQLVYKKLKTEPCLRRWQAIKC